MMDNSPRYKTGQKPFYEVYFLKFHLLEEGIAFWIRYTFHAPRGEEPWAGLWAFALEEKTQGELRGGLQRFPIDPAKVDDRGCLWKIGEASLGEGVLRGKVVQKDFSMEWDLNYGEEIQEGRGLQLYPYHWMYRGPFPKTKYLIPFPCTRFSGRIVFQGKEYRVEKAPGEQAHIWGREHAKTWAWINCNTFLEDPTAVIEGLSATVQIGPFSPPPFRVFYLRSEGKDYPFHSACRWFRNRSAYGLESWDFDAIEGAYRLMGSLTSDPEKVIGVRYTDPDGSFRYCHHAEWAELRLGLYKKKGERWEEMTALHSRAASFEVVDLAPDPRVEVKVLG